MAEKAKKKRGARGLKPGCHLAALALRLWLFMGTYSAHFKLATRDQGPNAAYYIKGLTSNRPRKNMERMTFGDSGGKYQSLQQFITDSPWSAREVMDHVAKDADQLIGDPVATALVIDESGIVKKGGESVGTARQWIGNVGKVENGQVAVYAALVNGSRYCLTDARLYLPESWTSDPERLNKAKVPVNERTFKSKETIALEMIKHAHELGLRFGWISADAGYGKSLAFPLKLEELGDTFVIDVHKDQLIYLEEPHLEVPDYSGRGRKPSQAKVDVKPVRVGDLVVSLPEEALERIMVRDGAKGLVIYEYFIRRVWVVSTEAQAIREWHLIVRRDLETKSDYKYSLSNAAADTPKPRLAYMQGQRYWVERSFEDGKQDLGLADYQHRKWQSWQHHMALVMMALLFLMMEKIENQKEAPLLTGRDVTEILSFYLQDPPTEEELFREINLRHRKRKRDMENARKRQRKILEKEKQNCG